MGGRDLLGPTQCIVLFHMYLCGFCDRLWPHVASFSPDTQSLWPAERGHLVVPGAPFPPLCCQHHLALRPQGAGAPWGSFPLTKQQASRVLPPRSLTHRDLSDTPDAAPTYPAPDGHIWPAPPSRPCLCPRAVHAPSAASVTAGSPPPVGTDPGALGCVWLLWPSWAPSPLHV